ncbi:MAG: hypothetical protein ABI641_10170 [Caldimonas sp.]
MKLSAARAQSLVWPLIYGGLAAVSLGYALQRNGAGWGWLVVAAGAVGIVAGVVLIWIRSRLNDTP